MLQVSHTDYPKILMVDHAETGKQLAPVLLNQYKCHVDLVKEQKQILEKINEEPDLILILDKKDGNVGRSVAMYIRLLEKRNNLKSVTIVTLLSNQSSPELKNLSISEIKDYQTTSRFKLSLHDVLEKWLPNSSFPSNDSEIDESTLDSMANDFSDLRGESVKMFVYQYKDKITEIKVCRKKHDDVSVKEAAHFMESSSFTLGACKLGELFNFLESQELSQKEFEVTLENLDKSFVTSKNAILLYIEKYFILKKTPPPLKVKHNLYRVLFWHKNSSTTGRPLSSNLSVQMKL